MKEINLKHLITQHVNSIDDDVDCTSSIMQKINESKTNPSFRISFKRPFVIVLILFLISTFVYAATSEILKLRNSSGDEVASIQITEAEKNYHLDTHYKYRDLITYKVDEKLKDGPVIVIDTSDTSKCDVRYHSKNYSDYSELATITNVQLLPEDLANFELTDASVCYGLSIPSEEEIRELAAKNSAQRFYAHPLEKTDTIEIITYMYKEKSSDREFLVRVDYGSGNNFTVYDYMVDEYQIVNLNSVEGFLRERKEPYVVYSGNTTTEVIHENDYSLDWYETEYGFSVNCSPIAEGAYYEVLPSDTDEILVQLGTEINKILNEN